MRLLHAASDLILGTACVGCDAPGPVLCATCADDLVPRPRTVGDGPPVVTAAGDYAGVLREAVVGFKEHGVLALRDPLARCLAASVVQACGGDEALVLVPVPSRRAAVRERGHDALADLARRAAVLLRGVGVDARAAPVLAQRRGVRDQAGLGRAERLRNLDRALVRRRRLPPGRAVVVVDDVLTTGASAASAVACLGAGGSRATAVAVVAATRSGH
ncbi:ComF family protein [Solicola sp. PLA-1-18]|uniref:ComF family protein n=1 Tax=Solicola sp. PLA-1-18 TaxID=3380532 RepID=UPI003B77C5FE